MESRELSLLRSSSSLEEEKKRKRWPWSLGMAYFPSHWKRMWLVKPVLRWSHVLRLFWLPTDVQPEPTRPIIASRLRTSSGLRSCFSSLEKHNASSEESGTRHEYRTFFRSKVKRNLIKSKNCTELSFYKTSVLNHTFH